MSVSGHYYLVAKFSTANFRPPVVPAQAGTQSLPWHEQGASALTPAPRKDHAIADYGAQSTQVSTRGAIS
jgi:hypothetical protein